MTTLHRVVRGVVRLIFFTAACIVFMIGLGMWLGIMVRAFRWGYGF